MSNTQKKPAPSLRRSKRLRGWLINIALILLVSNVVHWWKPRLMVAGEAPPLAEMTLEGERLDIRDLRGKPVLVHFWATWCPICTLMDGVIDAIAEDHAVVTLAMQSGNQEELRRFMREAGLEFPVIADPIGRIATGWGVRGVPATFVLDPAGRIDYATIGVSTSLGLRARLWLAGRGS